jgi:hypothetical protein
MKYIWMTIAGFLVGSAVGAALLLFNPLIASGDARLVGFERMLQYALPADAVVLTHGGTLPIERKPFEVEPLWESTIRSTSLATLALRDETGEPLAVASRIASPSKRTELLTAGVLANDHWLVSVPDDGAFFIVAETNVSTMAKDTLVAVKLLGREWQGPRMYAPTEGPEIAGTARVIGASGAYAERSGRALERYRIDEFARAEGLEKAAAELYLALDAPALTLDESASSEAGFAATNEGGPSADTNGSTAQ